MDYKRLTWDEINLFGWDNWGNLLWSVPTISVKTAQTHLGLGVGL